MKVLFLPEIIDYFLDLADILYGYGYFGFIDTAIKYSDMLFDEIKDDTIYFVRYISNNHLVAQYL